MLILQDEAARRDGMATSRRAQRANLDSSMIFEEWDATAKVTYDKQVLNELVSLRFVEARNHAAIYGPSGVGKTVSDCRVLCVDCARADFWSVGQGSIQVTRAVQLPSCGLAPPGPAAPACRRLRPCMR